MDEFEYKHLRGPRGEMLYYAYLAALILALNLCIIWAFVRALIPHA